MRLYVAVTPRMGVWVEMSVLVGYGADGDIILRMGLQVAKWMDPNILSTFRRSRHRSVE